MNTTTPQPQIVDKTLTPLVVNVLGLLLMPVIIIMLLIPYWLIWHEIAFVRVDMQPILISLIPSILIHEVLHGVGYMLAGARRDQVKLGFQIKNLMPYAHCKVPLRTLSYAFGVILPGLILGVIPYIAGIVAHHQTLTVYAIMMILAAVGDLIMLVMLVAVPRDLYVQDHPTKPGFQVLSTLS
jgi:hypothetical protein